jgi:hypothetical protein
MLRVVVDLAGALNSLLPLTCLVRHPLSFAHIPTTMATFDFDYVLDPESPTPSTFFGLDDGIGIIFSHADHPHVQQSVQAIHVVRTAVHMSSPAVVKRNRRPWVLILVDALVSVGADDSPSRAMADALVDSTVRHVRPVP